jgi:hypothetical protein
MILLAMLCAATLAASPRVEALDPVRSAEREALRALAAVAAAEPGIVEVQDAAARVAARAGADAADHGRRARLAALLPRLTAEIRQEDRSSRVVGMTSSGEVDYDRLAPGRVLALRASWDLPDFVAARGEVAAASAEGERARRTAEAVRRATTLYYDRRRAQLALLLAPPEAALVRAEAELEIDRMAAELDALTGGLLSGRRR